jgi:hypothetical protein
MKILEVLKDISFNSEVSGQDSVGDMYYKYQLTSLDKPIVITFPPNRDDINNDLSVSPFNFDFLCRFDVNIICFGVLGSHKNNFFMHPEFSKFIEVLGLALKPFRVRLGYANSKGGFGIGAYANSLGLDYAILFHPISTKNIDLVPWDTRSTTNEARHLDWTGPYSDVNLGRCTGYIIYDPRSKIDVNHANRFVNFKHIKINGFGHGRGYYFLSKHTNLIKEVIEGFLYNQTVDIPNIRRKSKLLRFTPFYYSQLLAKKPRNEILIKNKSRLNNFIKSPAVNPTGSFTDEEINVLRDSALALESIDLNKALRLMKIALKIRPAGPILKKKVNEYKKKLGEN